MAARHLKGSPVFVISTTLPSSLARVVQRCILCNGFKRVSLSRAPKSALAGGRDTLVTSVSLLRMHEAETSAALYRAVVSASYRLPALYAREGQFSPSASTQSRNRSCGYILPARELLESKVFNKLKGQLHPNPTLMAQCAAGCAAPVGVQSPKMTNLLQVD